MNSLKTNIYCKLPNRPASDSWLYRLFSTDPTLSVEDEAVSRKERNKKKKRGDGKPYKTNILKQTYRFAFEPSVSVAYEVVRRKESKRKHVGWKIVTENMSRNRYVNREDRPIAKFVYGY